MPAGWEGPVWWRWQCRHCRRPPSYIFFSSSNWREHSNTSQPLSNLHLARAELKACVVRVTNGGRGHISEALLCIGEGSRVWAVRCTLDAATACVAARGGASVQLLRCQLGSPDAGVPFGVGVWAAGASRGGARAPPAHGASDPTRGLGLLRPLLAPAGWGGPAQLAAGAPAGAGCSAGGGSACAADGVECKGELWPRPRCATGAMAFGGGSVVEARGCAVAAWLACAEALGGGRVELARCTLNAAVGAGWGVFGSGLCAVAEGRAPVLGGAPAEAGLSAAVAPGHGPPQAGRGNPSVVALHECQLWAILSFARAKGGGRVEGLHTCQAGRRGIRVVALMLHACWAGRRRGIPGVALVVALMSVGIAYAW